MHTTSFRSIFPGYIILICCLLSGFSAAGQEFQRLTTSKGESYLSIRDMVQDRKGIVWLATFSGLYRYCGGEHIEKAPLSDTMDADLTSLLVDRHGAIWVGSNNGVYKYDPRKEKIEAFTSRIGNLRVRALCADSTGGIYIGTKEQGLFYYWPQTGSFYTVSLSGGHDLSFMYIRSLFFDEQGYLWIGTLYDGVYYCKIHPGEKLEIRARYATGNKKKTGLENSVYRLDAGPGRTVVAGTQQGIHVFDANGGFLENIPLSRTGLNDDANVVRAVTKTKGGTWWIATWNGVYVASSLEDIKKGRMQNCRSVPLNPYSLSSNQVLSVFEDNSGIIWVGTESGLNKYDPYTNQFRPVEAVYKENLKEKSFVSVGAYGENLLMLTRDEGLFVWEKGIMRSFSSLSRRRNFTDYKLLSMYVDVRNRIWLGTYTGELIRMSPAGKTEFFSPAWDAPVYSLCEYGGLLLAGTYGKGIQAVDVATGCFVADMGAYKLEQEINRLYADRQGRLWAVTQRGVFMKRSPVAAWQAFRPESDSVFADSNAFFAIAESASGRIFTGSKHRMYVFSEEENDFVPVILPDSPELWITDMQFDSADRLWLNLNYNKIARYDLPSGRVLFYTVRNGVRSSRYNLRAFYLDRADNLYVSGFDQLYAFSTKNAFSNTCSPTPVFTKLIVNTTEVTPGKLVNRQQILTESIAYQSCIRLNRNNGDFELFFSSPSALHAAGNQYRYRLLGYDKQWQVTSNARVNYTNLNAGTYRFEVYGVNNEGVESSEAACLEITILPSPFLAPWAIALYIAAAMGAVYFFFRSYRIKARLKYDWLLEKVKREKEEKMHEERLALYTHVAHELRTPLTLIVGPCRELLDKKAVPEKCIRYQELIFHNANRLLAQVNQILDFRKAVYKGDELKVISFDLIRNIRFTLSSFQYILKENLLELKFDPPAETWQVWLDMEKFNTILFNLLANACKYTPHGGRIELEVFPVSPAKAGEPGCVGIRITNTGKPIPESNRQHLFEPFFRLDAHTFSKPGSGIGLSLVKRLVDLHHGNITVSAGEHTTAFTVVLPVSREAYSGKEVFDYAPVSSLSGSLPKSEPGPETDSAPLFCPSAKPATVLIVEDNRELVGFLREVLESEYTVHCAFDGREGIGLCRQLVPDLVLSDIMMDGMNGLELCAQIKKDETVSYIPVILMSAIDTSEIVIEGYKNGADDYVCKPFTTDVLRVRIRNLIRRVAQLKERFSRTADLSAKELTLSKIDEEFIERLSSVIETNLQEESIGVDFLSRELGTSASRLYRRVKAITNLSPNEFVTNYKLKKAIPLFRETNLTISEIAFRTGFNDPRYFTKCFKKYFGKTPTEYFNLKKHT